MATELKTDSRYRYTMYRRDEYRRRSFSTVDEKAATDAGKRFAARAYADIWAKDPDLVRRVRMFLGENFHWHDRLAKSGSDLEVVQTLMDMVRGNSVVLIASDAPASGGAGHYVAPPPVSRSFHRLAMEWMGLSAEAATAYVSDYNDRVERLNAKLDAWRAARDSDLAPDSDSEISTPLGDAQAFEYSENMAGGDVEEIAARGVSAAQEAECFTQYEFDMDVCGAIAGPMGGARGLALCRQRAFANFQQCRGF